MPDLDRCAHCGGTRGPSGCCRELDGDVALLARVVRTREESYQRLIAENAALLRALDKYRVELMRRTMWRAGVRGRLVKWLERVLGL